MIVATNDAAFSEAVNATSRNFDAKIFLGNTEIECDILSIKTTKGACDSEFFSVGSVCSSSVEIDVANLATALDNQDITLKIGIAEGGTYDYIEYGHYTVIKAPKTTKRAEITGVGFITSKLTQPINLASETPTINQIASAIGTACGITPSVPNGGNLALTKSVNGMAARSALELIAALLGGFATETNTGGIAVKLFSIPNSKVSINGDRCLTEPKVEDNFSMTGIKVVVTPEEEDDEGAIIPEVEYHTSGVIRQVYENEYMTQAIFSRFSSNIVGYAFTPATVDLSLGDPRLEPWDCLEITDENDNTFNVPCHIINSTFDGGFSSEIKSNGESETEPEAEGSLTRQFSDLSGKLATTQIAATAAKAAAAAAQSSADDAADAASAAQSSATAAAGAAATAQSKADEAEGHAQTALTNAASAASAAANAQADATRANTAATNALNGLSTVQDVVGVVEWAAAHSQEDMASYINSHLSLTTYGLNLTLDNTGYRIHIGTYTANGDNGVYVIDASGNVVTFFGENIRLAADRPQYIGGNDAYIIFYDTNNDGVPDSIRIGGNVVLGGNKTLAEALAELDTAENTLIYDHDYETKTDQNNRKYASFTAYLYRGGEDVKTEFEPEQFTWYLKNEDTTEKQYLGYGYTMDVYYSDAGYGSEVVGHFNTRDNSEALTTDGDNLTDDEDTPYTVRASGDSIRVSDLTVSTTIYDAEKLMVVGAEDEHLVTLANLYGYILNKMQTEDGIINCGSATEVVG